MEVFAARFPVFDVSKEVYGYELAFRAGFEAYYQALEADKTKVDFVAFVDFGELTSGRKGFVHFTRDLLMMDFPLLFAPDALVPCLNVAAEGDEELLARCHDLKQRGYLLAADGRAGPMAGSPLLEMAGIIRVDASALEAEQQREICAQCKSRGAKALALGVQSEQQFQQALSLGFEYFQGEFFSRPDTSQGGKLSANKLICLRVLHEVNKPELCYDEIAKLVERDVLMTYTLLRLINSAWFGLRYEVKSIRQALVLLGPPEIRRWASLAAMNRAGEDKPGELIRLALTRAKFAEQLGLLAGLTRQAPELYLMGMFSILDALMDQSMEQLLAEVALSEQIKRALLGGASEYRPIYEAMLAYEHGQWVLFADLAKTLRIDEKAAPEAFKKALAWSDQATRTE